MPPDITDIYDEKVVPGHPGVYDYIFRQRGNFQSFNLRVTEADTGRVEIYFSGHTLCLTSKDGGLKLESFTTGMGTDMKNWRRMSIEYLNDVDRYTLTYSSTRSSEGKEMANLWFEGKGAPLAKGIGDSEYPLFCARFDLVSKRADMEEPPNMLIRKFSGNKNWEIYYRYPRFIGAVGVNAVSVSEQFPGRDLISEGGEVTLSIPHDSGIKEVIRIKSVCKDHLHDVAVERRIDLSGMSKAWRARYGKYFGRNAEQSISFLDRFPESLINFGNLSGLKTGERVKALGRYYFAVDSLVKSMAPQFTR